MLERAKEATHNSPWTYVEYARFADDMVILVDSHPRQQWLRQAIEKRLREELAKLEVEVNEEKSRKVDLTQGGSFGFLGFEFRRILSRRGRWMPLLIPKSKKRTALLGKLKAIFRHSHSQPVNRLIQEINPILRGVTLRSETRVGVSRISETGSRKRFGTIWHEPASVEVSDGNGGVKNGCTKRWDPITSTACPIPRKRLPSDRSHKL